MVGLRCVSVVQPDELQSRRVVHLGHPGLKPAALKAVLVFMYSERLDVGIEEVESVLRVLRKCRLKHMVACVMKERRTLRYYFKSTRKDEAGPRRSGTSVVPSCVEHRIVFLSRSQLVCSKFVTMAYYC